MGFKLLLRARAVAPDLRQLIVHALKLITTRKRRLIIRKVFNTGIFINNRYATGPGNFLEMFETLNTQRHGVGISVFHIVAVDGQNSNGLLRATLRSLA
ncbi:hypothetical protein D3C75_1112520 [compost metagenome]